MAASRTVAMLRRLGRIMLWGIGGFVIGSIVLVMLIGSCRLRARH
jgi:hypothetical protein